MIGQSVSICGKLVRSDGKKDANADDQTKRALDRTKRALDRTKRALDQTKRALDQTKQAFDQRRRHFATSFDETTHFLRRQKMSNMLEHVNACQSMLLHVIACQNEKLLSPRK